jgi:hypothetical protein
MSHPKKSSMDDITWGIWCFIVIVVIGVIEFHTTLGTLGVLYLCFYAADLKNNTTEAHHNIESHLPKLKLQLRCVFEGLYLAGGKYVMVFFRWATRVTHEKLMRVKAKTKS